MSFQNLLVPLDFSDNANLALRLAVSLARNGAARITLLHVGVAPGVALDLGGYGMPIPPTLLELHEKVAHEQALQLDRIARAHIPEDVTWTAVVREGDAVETILDVAKDGYDLLVMGTHGRRGLERLVLGSVTERVLRAAPIPVLVTR